MFYLSHRHIIAIASQVVSCVWERPNAQVHACYCDDASRFALKNYGGTEKGEGVGMKQTVRVREKKFTSGAYIYD